MYNFVASGGTAHYEMFINVFINEWKISSLMNVEICHLGFFDFCFPRSLVNEYLFKLVKIDTYAS